EHQSLITCALFSVVLALGRALIHTLRDVLALAGEDIHDEYSIGVKDVVIIHVPDFPNGVANDLGVVEFGVGSDFAADNDNVALGVSFAGDSAASILRET